MNEKIKRRQFNGVLTFQKTVGLIVPALKVNKTDYFSYLDVGKLDIKKYCEEIPTYDIQQCFNNIFLL